MYNTEKLSPDLIDQILSGRARYTLWLLMQTSPVIYVSGQHLCMSGCSLTTGPGVSGVPIGQALSRTLKIAIDNSTGAYDGLDFRSVTFTAWILVNPVYSATQAAPPITKLNDLGVTYDGTVFLGGFKVNKPPVYGDTIQLTASDFMCLADTVWTTKLTEPTTVAKVYREALENAKLSISQEDASILSTMGALAIKKLPQRGRLTNRQILADCAALMAANVVLEPNRSTVKLKPFSDLRHHASPGVDLSINPIRALPTMENQIRNVYVRAEAPIAKGEYTISFTASFVERGRFIAKYASPTHGDTIYDYLFDGDLEDGGQSIDMTLEEDASLKMEFFAGSYDDIRVVNSAGVNVLTADILTLTNVAPSIIEAEATQHDETIHLNAWSRLRVEKFAVQVTGVKAPEYGTGVDVMAGNASGTVLSLTNSLIEGVESAAVKQIYNAVKGNKVLTFDGDHINIPLLEFFDPVTVTDRMGRSYFTWVTDAVWDPIGIATIKNASTDGAGALGERVVAETPTQSGTGQTIRIGVTTKVSSNSPASVKNVGTDTDMVLDFEIPSAGVESDESGIWRYEKSDDGTLKVWGTYDFSAGVACSTKFGNVSGWYNTSDLSLPSYPISFISQPVVTMGFRPAADGVGAAVWVSSLASVTKPPNARLFRPGSTTSLKGYLDIIAIGRWQ